MTEPEVNTEKKILDAAKVVFLKNGFDGARMQEIATEAGINKALLHYYFRSKDKLFDAIFSEAFSQFLPKVGEAVMTDKPFFEKLKIVIDSYINMLVHNPHLPIFVLHELHRNPGRIVQIIKSTGVDPAMFTKVLKAEIKKGNLVNIKAEHLVPNIIGLCLFPFVARPILQAIIFNGDEKAYDRYLMQRKDEVYTFIINALIKK